MVYRKSLKKQIFGIRPFARLKQNHIFLKRKFRFLPHLFTLGNAFFGFSSLILVFEGELVAAAYCIFLGALMDALDGRVARFMGVESELGVQLDSLCDAISFCLAPAFLVYVWILKQLGIVGVIVGALFLLAGLLRLARFNLIHAKQTIFFLGLPTTVAGCFLTTVLLNSKLLVYNSQFIFFVALLVVILSWLMISSVRFPSFKQKLFRAKKNYHIFIFIFIFAIIAIMRFKMMLLLLFLAYFLTAFRYKLSFRGK